MRIQGLLDPLHQFDRQRIRERLQCRALESADPMLGAETSGEFAGHSMNVVGQRLGVVEPEATGIGRNEVRFYRTLRPGLDLRSPEVHGVASLPGDDLYSACI